MDFNVDNETWAQIVPIHLRNYGICLRCFDKLASVKGIKYAHKIQDPLYFVGEMANFHLTISGIREPDLI